MVSAPPASSSLPSSEQDWADISDEGEDEPAPTVKVDSLDLTSLSLKDKDKTAPTRTLPLQVNID
jgi:hypothetical protein